MNMTIPEMDNSWEAKWDDNNQPVSSLKRRKVRHQPNADRPKRRAKAIDYTLDAMRLPEQFRGVLKKLTVKQMYLLIDTLN